MAVKMYEVLKGQKYKGKHRVYKEGQQFPETELFGNEDNIKMALEGAKDDVRKSKSYKDKNGREVPGKDYIAIKGKSRKIKLVTGSKKADSK